MNSSHILRLITSVVLLLCFSRSVAQVTISAISPASGPVGATVNISGGNFDNTAANNVVWFGATRAAVTSVNANSLTVTVPAGASYSPISVLNLQTHLSARSLRSFLPVYSPITGSVTAADFSDKQSYGTADGPTGVAIADLDGDGRPDIAVATTIINVVSVLLNNGNTGVLSFSGKVDFPVGLIPSRIIAGDIDGDGKPDLVVSNTNSNTVSVLRNTSSPGNLSFVRRDFATGKYPNAIAIADFDRDGRPDLAIADNNDDFVSVLRNTSVVGSISFDAKVDYRASILPTDIVAGDIDGDGNADIITDNYSGSISVLLNLSTPGKISFSIRSDFSAGFAPRAMALGDFDGDGKYDIALSNEGAATVLRSTSSTGNVSFAPKVDFTNGTTAFGMASGDLDGDGRLDLVTTATPVDARISVVRNTTVRAGTLSFATNILLSTGRGPDGVAINDLDGDGRPEIIVATNGDGYVRVFHNIPQAPVDVQATNIIFTGTTGTGTQISWTSGSGTARAVFIKAAAAGTPAPADQATYTPNMIFPTGTQIGTSGWYSVYNGTGSSVTVTGLSPGTVYQVMVNEYAGTAGSERYFQGSSTGNPAGFSTLSSDATLSNLTTNTGSLLPVFASGTVNYTVTVPNNITGISFTPTVNVSGASVKVNGNTVISGNPSVNMALSPGINPISIVVTSPDGVTKKTYTITVTRTLSADADLVSLTPGIGTLNPVFSPAITAYTVIVPFAVSTINFRPISNNSAATIKINGSAVASGSNSASLTLTQGNNQVNVVILAQDGVTSKTYIVVVVRSAAPDASLSNLVPGTGSLTPLFSPATTNYALALSSQTISLTLTPTASASNSIISINGVKVTSGLPSAGIPLLTGHNLITVSVTASDGLTQKNYVVDASRAKGDQSLTFNPLPAKIICDADFAAGVSSSNPINQIVFTSSNPGVATISPSGVIHLAALGSTTITASQIGSNDFNDAIPQARTLTVAAPVVPDVAITTARLSLCPGETATLNASVSNVGGQLSYQWVANGVNTGGDSPILPISPAIGSSTYQCIVTNKASCNAMGSSNVITIVVSSPPPPSVSITSSTNGIACSGDILNFTASPASGGLHPVFQWLVNDVPAGSNSAQFYSGTLQEGDRVSCKLTNTDAICSVPPSTTSMAITVHINQPTQLTVQITASVNPARKGEQIVFMTSSYSGIGVPDYQWQVNGIAAGTNKATFSTTNLSNGDMVNCLVTAKGECSLPGVSNYITIIISKDQPMLIPTAFTPNGDGVDDKWELTGVSTLPLHVMLFNRSGAMVYESKNYSNDWGGTSNGVPLPIGTYYYIIKTAEEPKLLRGSVTLIR